MELILKDLMDRVAEDDGLVAGLSPEAGEVLRGWCSAQIAALAQRLPPDAAVTAAEELITRARRLAAVIAELELGLTPVALEAKLGRVTRDGGKALQTLQSDQPLPDRLRELVNQVPATAA